MIQYKPLMPYCVKSSLSLKAGILSFKFATYARKTFLFAKGKEGLELKKEILMGLEELPIIKD